MSDKLKPCPFCGGHAIIDGCDDTLWIVICKECNVSIGYKETKEEAIEAWNRRVEFNLSPKEIEELRKNFFSAIHDIPVSYYTEVRKPCIDERTQPTFTPNELDAIRRMFDIRRSERELSKIEQSIIDKCDDALKGVRDDTGNI